MNLIVDELQLHNFLQLLMKRTNFSNKMLMFTINESPGDAMIKNKLGMQKYCVLKICFQVLG